MKPTQKPQDKATVLPILVSSSTIICSNEAKIVAQCSCIEPIGVAFSESAANAALLVHSANVLPEAYQALRFAYTNLFHQGNPCHCPVCDAIRSIEKAKD